MRVKNPYHLLSKWRNRQIALQLFTIILLIFILIALYYYQIIGILSVVISSIIGSLGITWVAQKNPITIRKVLDLANEQNPAIEYSASLLTEPSDSNLLATIQKERISDSFGSTDYTLPVSKKIILEFLFFIILSLIIGFLAEFLVKRNNSASLNEIYLSPISNSDISDFDKFTSDSTYIKSVKTTIIPPKYTLQNTRLVTSPNLQIVEGSVVQWEVNLIGNSDKVFFLFADEDTLILTPPYIIKKAFSATTFYRYGFISGSNNYISDYHGIKVLDDQNPKISISGINEYSKLKWNENHQIDFNINITDDFGLSESFISATVAKGSGESVKFREREFPLNRFISGLKSYNGKYQFSTRGLEMEPGNELYFYVKARDNCPYEDQWTKSPTYFVVIEDTTQYELFENAGMQVDLMPDFFRSQRQIIVDSEKLLLEKNNISSDSFKRASNALGYDQKMLRLKYGQFLGEENESGIAIDNEVEIDHDHDDHNDENSILDEARKTLDQFMHDHDHEEEEGQLMATKGTQKEENPARPSWVEELSHNHDNMEENTFHDISVKSKLRAALSEMWDAELHLRLFDPSASLPYQYRSLSLLQEIKNHARIYVHRIGYDPPPIKESEKRLSGDQKEIFNRYKNSERINDDAYAIIKTTIGKLQNEKLSDLEKPLRLCAAAMANIALERPETLPILSDIQSILKTNTGDIKKLRMQLLNVLPKESIEVKNNTINSHEITLQVAKKMRS